MAMNHTPGDMKEREGKGNRRKGGKHLLADQEDVDRREVEIIEIGHGRHSLTTSVHPCIELRLGQPQFFDSLSGLGIIP